MGELRSLGSPPIPLLSLFGCHPDSKRLHSRTFFGPHHRPAMFFILRTTRSFQRTMLTILLQGFVFVHKLAVLFLLSLILELLAGGTYKTVLLSIVAKLIDAVTIRIRIGFAGLVPQTA